MKYLFQAIVATVTIACSAANAATILTMNTRSSGWYFAPYDFMVFSPALSYELSDGTTWQAGAGLHPYTYATLASVSTSNDTIRYTFNMPSTGLLFQNTDYNSANHSAQGELGLPSELSIVASIGETTGLMRGYTQIVSNQETWYGTPRFNYYAAPVGSYVYFEQHFSLVDATFTDDLFEKDFTYYSTGFVDFTRLQAVPEPTSIALCMLGLLALRTSNRLGSSKALPVTSRGGSTKT